MAQEFDDISLVHVVRQYTPMIGGLEDFVRQLVSHQNGRFGDLKVVTLDRLFIEPDKILPQVETVDGVEVHRIPFRGSSRYPIAPGVFSQIKDADLVHVHAVDFFFDALAWGKLLHRRRLVATTHGGFFHTDALQGLKKVWFNSVTRLSATQYRGIACCSDNDLAMFQSIAPSKAKLIENGVNLDKFQDAASGSPQNRLVTLGRFSQNKHLERVLDALKALLAHDEGWQLAIIGGPSDLTVSDLNQLIAERGLEGQVSLHVKVPDEEVRRVMATCSFFVSASNYEGFGIAMIEGLSAGLIPIVEPNDAFKGLARKHPMVRLATFSEPEAAANAILKSWSELCAKPQLRSDAIASAALHSWETTIRQYDTLYQDALAK